MPKPFVFKLEKVLDYRAQLEEQAKMVLAKAQAAFQAQTDVVEGLKGSLAEAKQLEYGSRKAGADEIWLARQYRQGLELDLVNAEIELKDLALKLQNCRQDALAKSRDRKLLEKLKENQAKKHHAEEQLKEEKEFDELATVRYEPPDL